MMTGFWGKKIGMTQVFFEDRLIPVTVIDTKRWIIIGSRTVEKDGYNALRVGFLRSRYIHSPFSLTWLKDLKTYFMVLKEVPYVGDFAEITVGKSINFSSLINEGSIVDVIGTTIGRGFAGVVKRHGFAGGPASHGDEMGRAPGSSGHMHTKGRIIKGKRFPGRLGGKRHTVKSLSIVRFDEDKQIVFIKGAIPGKSGSLVFVKKT